METTYIAVPEFWLVQHKRSGQFLTDAWFNQARGQWCCDFDLSPTEALQFATKEAALNACRAYCLTGKTVGLKHVTETRRMTEAGKASVAAKRAARNAERKL